MIYPWARALIAGGLIAFLAACASKPETPPSGGGGAADYLSLTPVAYSDLPGWNADAVAQAIPPLLKSCARILQMPPSRAMGMDGRAGLAADWMGPCGAVRSVPADNNAAARAFFEQWFQPYRAFAGTRPDGLFTGYYEADLNGSRKKSGRYRVPLHARPAGLSQDPSRSGTPYLSRAEIEAGALNGKTRTLLWVDDPVDAHILHIQGSGKVRLDDGQVVHVGFDGSNGQPFRGLGAILRDHGKLKPGEITMPSVRDWLKAHPDQAPALMAENPRYVFFREVGPDGPFGAAGVALTPGRSLAVDTTFVALGTPLWLVSSDPDGAPLRRLMIAQDTGSAIKGPIRGDFFWGAGDAAFNKAGRMKSKGGYYLLLPRERRAPLASNKPG